jgi:hypothetical protein
MAMEEPRPWAEEPPAWVLPVTIAGDLVLVREPGVLVSVGAICAYPSGFEFYLTIGLDRARVADRKISFRVHSEEDRASAARLRVGFSDGQVGDSLARGTGRVTAGELLLRWCRGESGIQDYSTVPRCESQWWVSPLPPPGPVEFTVVLPGAVTVGAPTDGTGGAPDAVGLSRGPVPASGTARVNASLITSAAAGAQSLWPGPR